MNLAVIDYGAANLGSVTRTLARVGAEPKITADPADLAAATHIVLPGVGSYADCARNLRAAGWVEAIRQEVACGKAVLGVCVGMQLLATEGTEFGINAGLDLIPGRVERLDALGCGLRIPHVGWNALDVRGGEALLEGIGTGTDVYFVHSYAFRPADEADVWAWTDYGVPLPVVVGRGRVMGVQFHPEKSSRAGQRLLRNFLELPAC